MAADAGGAPGTDSARQNRGQILAVLPLTLLEMLREQDHPIEVLEDEDISASLPRRLGLTGVVSSQIRRYEQAGPNGRVAAAEVTGLMQLVLRRPDAGSILEESGRRVTRRHLGRTVPAPVRLLRRWDRLAFIPMRNAARRLLRGLVGDVRTSVSGRPMVVRMDRSPLGAAGNGACGIYTGALDELVRLYSNRPHAVKHAFCTARGDERCEWTVE